MSSKLEIEVDMASENKKRKLKNSYYVGGVLKNKKMKMKRILFFTPSMRKEIKSQSSGLDLILKT